MKADTIFKEIIGSSHHGSVVNESLGTMRLWVQCLTTLSGLRIRCCHSCGVGCGRSLDPALLWPWRGLVAATLIGPLAWEPPYAGGAALEKAKRQRERERKQTNHKHSKS